MYFLSQNINYFTSQNVGVKRTSRTALNTLIKPATELTSPPEKKVDTPKRKHSETEAPKPADDASEDTPIAKKRSRRNNASVDANDSEPARCQWHKTFFASSLIS
jgi:hypothetical protein